MKNPASFKSHGMLDFIRKISVKLGEIATPGPVVIIIAYLVCVTVVGLFGEGPIAESAMTILFMLAVIFLIRIADKVR